MRIGPDGRLWAINPENGFFGVAPEPTKIQPQRSCSTRQGTIFTNVVHNLDDNTVWWEGLDKNPAKNALNWKGENWNGTDGSKGAHPNSRFTAPAKNCPCISSEFDKGTACRSPPSCSAAAAPDHASGLPVEDWNNGVFVGSIMASETTAAASGAVGVVRRDPMAMLPSAATTWATTSGTGLKWARSSATRLPKIFNVNWFRLDDGNFIWPGFGDNIRVLLWMLDRCRAR